jgi:uncharacterized protein YecT (DUF1311 family)
MEAIFGVPSSVKPVRRSNSAGMNAHALPELELTRPMGPSPRWIVVALGISIALIAASFLVRTLLDSRMSHSTHSESFTQQGGIPPLAPLPQSTLLTKKTVASAIRDTAQPLPQRARAVAPKMEAVKIERPAPQNPPAVVAEAKPQVTETKPAIVAKTADPCEGTSYEHMASCPPANVRKADKALSTAYASAISANVDPAKLAEYSQKWSQMRETAAASPDSTADEFANMTSQLNALTVAEASRKK